MEDYIREVTIMKKSRLERVASLFPAGQIVRYLCVGVFNTAFAYVTFAVALTLLNNALPQRFLYLTVVLSSVIVTPLNITVAFFGYKFFVFRTKGNFVREWLRCFAVYGTGMIPGLIALSALTKLLQAAFHRDSTSLHTMLGTLEQHLSGAPLRWVTHIGTGKAMAGYVAGALMIFFTTIYSFMGHKHVTFKARGEQPIG